MINYGENEKIGANVMMIKQLLAKGLANNEFINFNCNARKIGKTTALIEFAKENDLNAVVCSTELAKYFQNEFQYANIYGMNEDLQGMITKAIIDEEVDSILLLDKKVKILTGYAY